MTGIKQSKVCEDPKLKLLTFLTTRRNVIKCKGLCRRIGDGYPWRLAIYGAGLLYFCLSLHPKKKVNIPTFCWTADDNKKWFIFICGCCFLKGETLAGQEPSNHSLSETLVAFVNGIIEDGHVTFEKHQATKQLILEDFCFFEACLEYVCWIHLMCEAGIGKEQALQLGLGICLKIYWLWRVRCERNP